MTVCNNEHPVFYTNFIQRNYDMTNHDEFLEFYQDTFEPTLSWNKLIKREVIGESKFKDYLKFAEDETFFCAIIGNVKKISTTSEVLLLLYTKEYKYIIKVSLDGFEKTHNFIRGNEAAFTN